MYMERDGVGDTENRISRNVYVKCIIKERGKGSGGERRSSYK